MALQRQAPVLPSNAPAIWGPSQQHRVSTRRALRERSGNQQHDVLSELTSAQQIRESSTAKSSRKKVSKGALGGLEGESDPEQWEPGPSPATGPPDWPASSAPAGLGQLSKSSDRGNDQWVEQEVASLWRELQECDQYQKYRSRQSSKHAKIEPVWPDNVERAFFRALVRWPPTGRLKFVRDGVKKGRNECIAAEIRKGTGAIRKRKQISSHIQNIRPMFEGNPRILQYLPDEKEQKKPSRTHARSGTSSRKSSASKSRPRPNYPQREVHCQLDYRNGQLHVPASFSPNHQARPITVEPFCFEMFVINKLQEPPIHLHTFTKNHEMPNLPEIHLHEVQDWQNIASMIPLSQQRDSDHVPVFYFDVSLELMTESLPDGAELGVQFELTSEYDLTDIDVDCCTTIYDGQLRVDSSSSPVAYDAEVTKRLHKVPFGSKFWARRIGVLVKVLREALTQQNVASSTGVHSFESEPCWEESIDRVRDSIGSLSAVQEISASIPGRDKDEVLLIIYWRFRHTTQGEPGITTWRKLIMPTTSQIDDVPKEDGRAGSEDVQPSLHSATESFAPHGLDINAFAPIEYHEASLNPHLASMVVDQLPDEALVSTDAADVYHGHNMGYSGSNIAMTIETAPQRATYEMYSAQLHHDQLQPYERMWPTFGSLMEPQHYHPQQVHDASQQYGNRRDYGNDGVLFAPDGIFGEALPSLRSGRGLLEAA